MATLTAYPAAGDNSPVDGFVWVQGVDVSWSTIRGQAGTNAHTTSPGADMIKLQASSTSSQYQQLWRFIMGFDTSIIGSDDTVDTATLSLVGNNSAPTDGLSWGSGSDLAVVDASPAAENTLASSDYGNVGTTRYASDTTQASWTDDGSTYNDISFNATGKSNISKTGNTMIGLRHAGDVDNTSPGWSSNATTKFSMKTADQAGTSVDPKLVVEYTPPVFKSQNVTIFGLLLPFLVLNSTWLSHAFMKLNVERVYYTKSLIPRKIKSFVNSFKILQSPAFQLIGK